MHIIISDIGFSRQTENNEIYNTHLHFPMPRHVNSDDFEIDTCTYVFLPGDLLNALRDAVAYSRSF